MKSFALGIILFLYSTAAHSQSGKEIVRSIYFGGGSWSISREQLVDLQKVVDGIKNLEFYEISVTSHTDNIGGKEFNEYLSHMRSQTVIDELVKMKVPQETIRYKDFDFTEPFFDNSNYEGRARNRRVDVIFTPITF